MGRCEIVRMRTYVCLEIWVRERIFDGYPLLGIKRLREGQLSGPRTYRGNVHTNVLVRKSSARGFAFGNSCANGFRFLKGNARM